MLVDPGVTTGPADRLQEGRGTFHRYDNADPLSGERPCAHRTLPKGTVVTVVNTKTGASTWCVVRDRGPFGNAIIDLDRGAVRRVRAGQRRCDQRAHHLVTLSGRDVAALLARHGLHPSRALGQNFVVDPNTVRRIARLAGVGPGDQVVEIGAGLGSLTLALAETGAAVTAVEIDRGIAPVLRTVVEAKGVRVVEADARLSIGTRAGRRPSGRWWPTSRTTWRRRSCSTCSTTCRRSSGCW